MALSAVFPQTWERKTRKPLAQKVQSQEVAPEAEAEKDPHLEDEQATEALPSSVVKVIAQVLEDAQAKGDPKADIVAMAERL